MKNIEKKIKKIISKQFGIKYDTILNNFSLRDDLKADSLDLVELIMNIEEKFKIEISDEEVSNFDNISSICIFLKKNKIKK
ncbi:acyl carrier protein [Buchnera aphidicola (Kurisakia onigurumii)]|uniref:acyl carrier protein n=1 Tax=Buchnera aphidicola TaxID=9 RepID=UPI0031B6F2F6